mgnify:CR=1 FL=1
MPLTLSFHEGHDFYVGDEQFVVLEVHLTRGCKVRKSSTGETFEVRPDKAVAVTDECKLSEGHRVITGKTRIVFLAPPSVKVLRGDNVEGPHHEASP